MNEPDPLSGYWTGGLGNTYGDQYGDYPLYGSQSGEGGDYTFPATTTTPSIDYTDPENLKLLRQQDIAQTGGSPLAGFGGEGVSQNVPLVDVSGGGNWLSKLINAGKNLGGKAADFAGTNQGLMALLAAIASYADRQRPSGGGTAQAYAGYKPLTRTMSPSQTPGKPSMVARYAAQGGIMHAYAQGGAVRPFQMQDGGFVLTKRAVDGAGGLQGLLQRIPEAVPIRGPGHGTSDSIPATIQGPRGQTPAKVSNGEAYVAPEDAEKRGGAPAMYALMRAMERKA